MMDCSRADIVCINPAMSPGAVARYLDIGEDHIRRLRREGRLPPPDFYIGNRPRWYFETIYSLTQRGDI